jgi:hypothetical protein
MSLIDPDQRTIYGDMLSPPVGYGFDCGVGTTFSLSLTTLLATPLRLTLNGVDDGERLLENRIALLEALQRTAGRMTLFCQKGFIAGERISALSALLEPMVQEIMLPEGVLHAKIWLLRFTKIGEVNSSDKALLRLVLPSRNVTLDRCWDAALVLDGLPSGGSKRRNASLVQLISWLAGQSPNLDADRRSQLHFLGQELARTEWALPDEFDELEFAVTGTGRRLRDWPLRPGARRIAVLSPFIRPEALRHIADQSPEAEFTLVSRIDQLETVSPEACGAAWQPYVLHQGLFDELGEASSPPPDRTAQGDLHAKIYLADYAAGRGGNLAIVVGSANATNAALVRQCNVEVLARLTGRHRLTGTTADLLGPEQFGKYLRPFQWPETPVEIDPLGFERALESARRAITEAHWRMVFEPFDTQEWRPMLSCDRRPVLPDGVHCSIRLATLAENRGEALDRDGLTTTLSTCATADATRFVAFTVTVADQTLSELILNLPDVVLPDGRDDAVIRSIISNTGAFLAYLRFLLGDLEGIETLDERLRSNGGTTDQSYSEIGAMPLLEDLLRAMVHAPERLRLIQRLIDRVKDNAEFHDVIPDGFMALWAAITPPATQESGE